MSRPAALALAATTVAAVGALCLVWGMSVGERDARLLAEHARARHLADCRAEGGVAVVVIRTDHADRLLCMAGSARMKGVNDGA